MGGVTILNGRIFFFHVLPVCGRGNWSYKRNNARLFHLCKEAASLHVLKGTHFICWCGSRWCGSLASLRNIIRRSSRPDPPQPSGARRLLRGTFTLKKDGMAFIAGSFPKNQMRAFRGWVFFLSSMIKCSCNNLQETSRLQTVSRQRAVTGEEMMLG